MSLWQEELPGGNLRGPGLVNGLAISRRAALPLR